MCVWPLKVGRVVKSSHKAADEWPNKSQQRERVVVRMVSTIFPKKVKSILYVTLRELIVEINLKFGHNQKVSAAITEKEARPIWKHSLLTTCTITFKTATVFITISFCLIVLHYLIILGDLVLPIHLSVCFS